MSDEVDDGLDLRSNYRERTAEFLGKYAAIMRKRLPGEDGWPSASVTMRACEALERGERVSLSFSPNLRIWLLSVNRILRRLVSETLDGKPNDDFVHPCAVDVLVEVLVRNQSMTDVAKFQGLRLPQLRLILDGACVTFIALATNGNLAVDHNDSIREVFAA